MPNRIWYIKHDNKKLHLLGGSAVVYNMANKNLAFSKIQQAVPCRASVILPDVDGW